MTRVVAATGDILAGALRVRHAVSPDGLTLHAAERLHAAQRKTAWGSRHQQTFALVDGTATLASAECYALQGVLDGREIAVRGIGSVCGHDASTTPEAVRTLVRTLADDTEAPVVLLFPSSAVNDLRLDRFTALPTLETTLRVIEATRYGAPMTTVRGGEERDLPAIVAMGRTRAQAFRFHLDRDDDFVRYALTSRRLLCGLGVAQARELQFFIAEEGITAAAYVVVDVTEGHWVVLECGDRDPTGARAGALLQALIAREPTGPRPLIRSSLPPGFLPQQVAVVSTQPTTSPVRIALRDPSTLALGAADVLYWPNDVR